MLLADQYTWLAKIHSFPDELCLVVKIWAQYMYING
jgi:hypothetical protein